MSLWHVHWLTYKCVTLRESPATCIYNLHRMSACAIYSHNQHLFTELFFFLLNVNLCECMWCFNTILSQWSGIVHMFSVYSVHKLFLNDLFHELFFFNLQCYIVLTLLVYNLCNQCLLFVNTRLHFINPCCSEHYTICGWLFFIWATQHGMDLTFLNSCLFAHHRGFTFLIPVFFTVDYLGFATSM